MADHRADPDAQPPQDPPAAGQAALPDPPPLHPQLAAAGEDDVVPEPPAHEPVLRQARVLQVITTTTPVVFTLMVAFGYQGALDETTTIQALTLAVGAAFAIAHWVAIRRGARRVRAVVTPVAAPTSATGEQLVALSAARALAARQAAAASLQVPVQTPWAEDTTLLAAPPRAGASPMPAGPSAGGRP